MAARRSAGSTGRDLVDRELPPPPTLTKEELATVDGLIKALRKAQHCKQAEEAEVEIPLESILFVCSKVRETLLSQPTLLNLEPPVNIVGDIHGQFLDLLRFFEVGGFPPEGTYLFLGDYVDRGTMGIECAMLLMCYKLRYPNNFFMLRGNHECTSISRIYGFYEECKRRYTKTLKPWRKFNEVFDVLPFAAIVGDRIFCTHGGLSPELESLQQIIDIQRPTDVPDEGLLCDLLWADPDPDVDEWEPSDRGVSFVFGAAVVEKFLEDNGFDLFVRAHQVVEDGYEFFPHDGRKLVTVFSAANYCGQFDNAGAMLIVDKEMICSFHVMCPIERMGTFQVEGRPGTPAED